jgi:hypothetical protein
MLFRRLIKFFTSLRLTVVLLAFAIVLVFIGTLAQVDEGLYQAQARYFRQWIVLGLDLFGTRIPIILPGGYLIGTLLLVNLLAAHIYRFQLSVKKIGIQLAHLGVIVLLVGQLVTDMFAHETQMHFYVGQTRSYSESPQYYELVFSTPTGSNTEQVVSIPASWLARGGVIQDTNLPFTIQVKQYWINSEPSFRAPMMQNGPPLATNGIALNFDFHPVPEAKTTDDKNVPTALIELDDAGGSLGDWVVSDWMDDAAMIEAIQNEYASIAGNQMAHEVVNDLTRPQTVFVDGKKYTFALRAERTIFPFSLTLLKATHTFYQGSDTPKDFRRESPGGNLHEPSAALRRPDLLPVPNECQRSRRGSRPNPVVRAHGRPQSQLVDAVCWLWNGCPWIGHPIYVPSRRFYCEEKMTKILP